MDTSNCLVWTNGAAKVGLIGVRDLAVVVEPDAVLVINLAASQGVKRLAEQMALAQTPEPEAPALDVLASQLTQWPNTSALPLWWALGADHARGGFHESLDQTGVYAAQQ